MPKSFARLGGVLLALMILTVGQSPAAQASTAPEIDAAVNAALDRLKAEVKGSDAVLAKAQGVLVFAGVIKAGLIIAGQGGEGALRIGGKTAGYYSIFAGSIGLQGGGQKSDIIMVFLDKEALKKFRESKGWKAGADGNVTVIDVGASGSIDTATLNQPIVSFVVGQKGLMAGVSIEGAKITKLDK